MVGYLLDADELNRDDLNTLTNVKTSIESLCSLGKNQCIRGPASLGTIMESHGLGIAYPSMLNPKPGQITFYEGGYITRNYVSKINAIQTELPYDMRAGKFKKTNAAKYATAVYNYLKANNLW